MELKRAKGELEIAYNIIKQWELTGELSALERALVIEKLKIVYDGMALGTIYSDGVLSDLNNSASAHRFAETQDEVSVSNSDLSDKADAGAGANVNVNVERVQSIEEQANSKVEVVDTVIQAESNLTEDYIEEEVEQEPTVSFTIEQDDNIKEIVSDDAELEVTTCGDEFVGEDEHKHENEACVAEVQSADRGEEGYDYTRRRLDRDAIRSLYDSGYVSKKESERFTKSEKTQQENKNIVEPAATENIESQHNISEAEVIEKVEIKEDTLNESHTKTSEVSATSTGQKRVLGEVINNDRKVLGDSFIAQNTVAANVSSDRVVSLRKSIGINDKYLIIRDLFNGDSDKYEEMVNELDKFTDLNDAILFLHDNYRWKKDCQGAKLVVELITRKLM